MLLKFGLYLKGKDEVLYIIIKDSHEEAKHYFALIKQFTEEQFDKLFDVKEIK